MPATKKHHQNASSRAALTVLAALLAAGPLGACSKGDRAASSPPSSHAAAVAAPNAGSGGEMATAANEDPCALLTDAEVREAFPGAAMGKREHALDAHGIRTCLWETPTDRFVVQTFEAGAGSVEDELRGRMLAALDPLMPGAAARIRYESIAGVGDQAVALVEKADPQRGVLADTAALVTRNADRKAVLFAGRSLTGGDRDAALGTLEMLGRRVAQRL